MKPTYSLVAVLCAGVVLTTSNCGEPTATGPTPPALQASRTRGSYASKHHKAPPDLKRCKPQPADIEVELIDHEGGEIDIGRYTLTIPPGALARPVFISAQIRAGSSVNVVEFQPDGLVFQVPATLSMSYRNCVRDKDDALLRIGVVDDGYQILYYLPSTNDPESRKITGEVAHFTNYAVAW